MKFIPPWFPITNYHPFASDSRVPFNTSCKSVKEWWGWTSSAFACLENSELLLQFWRTHWLGSIFLIVFFFFFLLALSIYYPSLSWPAKFLQKNLLIVLWRFSYMEQVVFHFASFKILSLLVTFDNLVIMCFHMVLCGFILFGSYKWWNFSAILFLFK